MDFGSLVLPVSGKDDDNSCSSFSGIVINRFWEDPSKAIDCVDTANGLTCDGEIVFVDDFSSYLLLIFKRNKMEEVNV